MKRYYSDDRKKELAMLFRVLKASGYTNWRAGRNLEVPWITLYKWGQKYLNVSRFDSNPRIIRLLNQAGEAMAKARTLPIHCTPRRQKPMTKREKVRIARMRKLAVEAFLAVCKKGHRRQQASQMVGKSVSTLTRWSRLYREGGLDSLIPYISANSN